MSQYGNIQSHPFHLVDASPWPFCGAFASFFLMSGGAMYLHSYSKGKFLFLLGLIMVLYTMYVWWRDIVRESTYHGDHTNVVQTGLRYGMLLFIVSEVMFFVAFFWAFFHASLSPAIELSNLWPPKGIVPFNPWEVPLVNTIILLSSGATVTWAHHAIQKGNFNEAKRALFFTIILAVAFTSLQVFEYIEASFTISDGIYGSTFFVSTGFHGLHVMIGTTFLSICLYRLLSFQFSREHHFGFEAAAWYWHFVDVVWLFLFIAIYWWGGKSV